MVESSLFGPLCRQPSFPRDATFYGYVHVIGGSRSGSGSGPDISRISPLHSDSMVKFVRMLCIRRDLQQTIIVESLALEGAEYIVVTFRIRIQILISALFELG